MLEKSVVVVKKSKYNFLAILGYFIFSLSSAFMKLASLQEEVLGKLLWYFASMICLFVFSVIWQILLKYMKLNKAYLFKGTTLLWGILFGSLLFDEKVNINMIIGVIITLIGIIVTFHRKREVKK